MGPARPGESGKPDLSPQIFRICPAQQEESGKVERPARIFRILQADRRGDRGAAELAAAQHGVVHAEQLRGAGFSRAALEHRRAVGLHHPVFTSVVAIGVPALDLLSRATAALLTAGDDAVLSHRTAGLLWGMVEPRAAEPITLTVIGRTVVERPDLRCHRVAGLDLRDVRLHRGLPVTAPARTLIDLAAASSDAELAAALNEARLLPGLDDAEIAAAVQRSPGRTGTGRLRRVQAAEHGRGYTQLELERRFRALVRDAQLPPPVYNQPLLGYRVDVLWVAERVVVELDGVGPHARPRAFHADRRRDQRLAAAGYVVLRVTGEQLRGEPMAVAVRVAQTLTIARARATLV
jgi:very-short-patch-repair endonuclease